MMLRSRLDMTKMRVIAGFISMLFVLSSSMVLAQSNSDEDENNEEEGHELGTVVVVGGRVEQSIEDVAGSISVMSSDDIEGEMVTNMSQLFRYEPGIEVTGSNGTAQNFVVRGMGADRVMMVKDGMRMNEGYGAAGINDVVGRGFIDMDTVKQVEVAKGAASSLYGADAMGGIVAFQTKDAADLLGTGSGLDFYFSANGGFDGRSDEASAGALTAFRTGRWETLVSYKGRKGHETQNYQKTRDKMDVDSNSVLAKTDYIIDENKKLVFSVDYYLQKVKRPDDGRDKGDYLGLPGWKINEDSSSNEKKNNSYTARYLDRDTGWAFTDSLDVTAYLNKTDQTDEFLLDHDTPLPMGPGGSRINRKEGLFSQETLGVSLSAGKQFGNKYSHQLSYGFDWDSTDTYRPQREIRESSEGVVEMDDLTAPFPKNTTDRYGIYLQDTIQLSDKWSVIPGLRYDYYKMDPKADDGYDSANPGGEFAPSKISDSNLSWRLGTTYDFTDNFSAFVQYSQGFKVPPYDLAYFYFEHEAFCDGSQDTCYRDRIIPADDLVPEESESFEVGIRGHFGMLSYQLSGYRSDYDNFIQIAHVETIEDSSMGRPMLTDVSQYQNIDSAQISGLEFSLSHPLGNSMSMFLNGEWMDSKDKTTGEQLSSIQPFNGTLGVDYFHGNFSMDAMLKWADSMTKTPDDTFTTGSYTTLDVFARYDFNDHFKINGGILNLLDKEFIRYTRVAGIPYDADRDMLPFTDPGRTFSVSLKYIF